MSDDVPRTTCTVEEALAATIILFKELQVKYEKCDADRHMVLADLAVERSKSLKLAREREAARVALSRIATPHHSECLACRLIAKEALA